MIKKRVINSDFTPDTEHWMGIEWDQPKWNYHTQIFYSLELIRPTFLNGISIMHCGNCYNNDILTECLLVIYQLCLPGLMDVIGRNLWGLGTRMGVLPLGICPRWIPGDCAECLAGQRYSSGGDNVPVHFNYHWNTLLQRMTGLYTVLRRSNSLISPGVVGRIKYDYV